MDFPDDFPKNLQPPVENSFACAEVDFVEALNSHWGGSSNTIEALIQPFIAKVFFAFARQARQAGLDDPVKWSCERIRNELDEFLRRLIIKVYFDKLPSHPIHEDQRSELVRRLKLTPQWVKHQNGMAALAKAISAKERGSSNAQTGRRALVEKFITTILDRTGRKITRKDIWRAAGYSDATDFERFQRNDSRTSKSAISAFTRILNMDPENCLRTLDKRLK